MRILKGLTIIFLSSFFLHSTHSQNALPVISNLEITHDVQGQQIVVSYELSDTDNSEAEVLLSFSNDDGLHFSNVLDAQGDIGVAVSTGTKEIIWNYGTNLEGSGDYKFRLVADDKEGIDISDIVNQVDQQNIKNHMLQIVGERHKSSPLFLNMVKDYLQSEISSAGLTPMTQEWQQGSYNASNFAARKLGLKNEGKIYLNDAHYDTVNGSPGADDNASGTAGVLTGLSILSQYQFENSIDFLFFDLEEDGLIGSIKYLSEVVIPENQDIEGVFNYEMIGFYDDSPGAQELPTGFSILFPDAYQAVIDGDSKGDFITNVANEFSRPLMQVFDSIAQFYVPELKVISVAAPGNAEIAPDLRRSDHAPFWQAGFQALMLTDGANFRNANYHEASDLEETIDYIFMTNVIKATIASIAHLAKPMHAAVAFENIQITTSNAAINSECEIEFYPSLVTDDLVFIDGKNCLDESHIIRLFNSNGSMLLEKSYTELTNNRIEIPKLASGTYLIQIDGKNLKQFHKFIKP